MKKEGGGIKRSLQHHPKLRGDSNDNDDEIEAEQAEEADLWRRYRAGESCRDIGKALGRGSESIRAMVRRHGGFSPRARHRHPRQLSLGEREEISRGLSASYRFDTLQPNWAEQRPVSAGRFSGMAGANAIERCRPISTLGSARDGRSGASFRSRHGCEKQLSMG